MIPTRSLLLYGALTVSSFAFKQLALPLRPTAFSGRLTRRFMVSATEQLLNPTERDAHYGSNVAQYLVDLHDAKATFDFCGGMLFQLVLSDKLRDHLLEVSSGKKQQPAVFDASKSRMFRIPEYTQNGNADNVRIFHGREIRKVPDAAGGMNFVLQLSLANGDDPEGWTAPEIDYYDGWGHDIGRVWRKGDRLEEEGFKDFRKRFGPEAFALHHRFYLHFDRNNRMWLSAEDGCEGTPAGQRSWLDQAKGLVGLR